jgi:hypothetical protein
MTAAHAHLFPADFPSDFPLDNDALERELTTLAGHINAANYRFLQLLARFDAQEGWSGAGVRSCAHWLEWRCGIGLGAAREKLRVARALESLPKIASAFARGELSYCMVRALTRKARLATEDYYLMIATHGTVSHVERLVRLHDRAEKLQEPGHEALQYECREASCYQDDDGNWVIRATLPPEAGARMVKALQAIIEKSEDEPAGIGRVEEGASYGCDVRLDDSPDFGEKPQRTLAQKRADALAQLAEHYFATGQDGTRSLSGGERCQVMLHVDLQTLRQNSSQQQKNPHAHCRLEQDTWLHPDTARRLSCDASLVTVLEDDAGKVLNIGRRSRIVPPHIQRALDTRDEGQCRYPGCQCRQYTDAHHVKHWADGGETSLDNLMTLCRYHHRALHRGEFTVDRDLVFRDVKGNALPETVTPAYAGDPNYDAASAPMLTVQKVTKGVSYETCRTQWRGEAMDYDMALNGLLGGFS